jgi:hypothetical protein
MIPYAAWRKDTHRPSIHDSQPAVGKKERKIQMARTLSRLAFLALYVASALVASRSTSSVYSGINGGMTLEFECSNSKRARTLSRLAFLAL